VVGAVQKGALKTESGQNLPKTKAQSSAEEEIEKEALSIY